MTARLVLGFDRKVEFAWLDAAAAAAARSASVKDARERLFSMLQGKLSGDGAHGGRGKTVTLLSRIWLKAPKGGEAMRTRALSLLPKSTKADRLAVHWAMCCATHPFFVDVTTALGRLLATQGDVSLVQVHRRVIERWGDRSTVQRAAQRVCRSLVEWKVIGETSGPGTYRMIGAPRLVRGSLARLLLEGLLVARTTSTAPFSELLRHPSLFAFNLNLSVNELRRCAEFSMSREGSGVDVLMLA